MPLGSDLTSNQPPLTWPRFRPCTTNGTLHIPMTIDYQLHLVGLVGQQEGGNGVPERVSFLFGWFFWDFWTSKNRIKFFRGVKYVEYMVEYNVCLLCWAGKKLAFEISSWNHICKMCQGQRCVLLGGSSQLVSGVLLLEAISQVQSPTGSFRHPACLKRKLHPPLLQCGGNPWI